MGFYSREKHDHISDQKEYENNVENERKDGNQEEKTREDNTEKLRRIKGEKDRDYEGVLGEKEKQRKPRCISTRGPIDNLTKQDDVFVM